MGKKYDIFTILNYQGSKKNLLHFINKNIEEYIDKDKAILDIFSGSGAVAYSLKDRYRVFANDSEEYASIIANSLLKYGEDARKEWLNLNDDFNRFYKKNYNELLQVFKEYMLKEKEYIINNDFLGLDELYKQFPTIWSESKIWYSNILIESIEDLRINKSKLPYMLFSTYYSTTYFGIKQSMEIDSIRYAIEQIEDKEIRNMLLSSLYFSMKECVFSKDGHMAQPLPIVKNKNTCFKKREKSILEYFNIKVHEFNSNKYVYRNRNNEVFNLPMDQLLNVKMIKEDVGFIYADPPYTDMQYSRYYHILNTVTKYDYDNISLSRGKLSKGLYREDRFQSPLSKKSKAKEQLEILFNFCKFNKINLGLSFAYPKSPEIQATNRYTMSIVDIINLANKIFGESNVIINSEGYEHSNNRNKESKKVLEYLIICKAKEKRNG